MAERADQLLKEEEELRQHRIKKAVEKIAKKW